MSSAHDDLFVILSKRIAHWGKALKHNADYQAYRAFFIPVLKTSSTVDSASLWLGAACGATAALILSNWPSLSTVFAAGTMRVTVLLLILSLFCGFLEKYCAVYVQLVSNLDESITVSLSAALEPINKEIEKMKEMASNANIPIEEIEPNIHTPVNDMVNLSPLPVRWLVKRAVEKGQEDWRYSFKKAMHYYYAQQLAISIQGLSYVFAIAFAAMRMKVA